MVHWPDDLDPAAIGPCGDSIHLVKGVVTVFRFPEETGNRIECEAKAVAAAVREDLVDVRHDLAQLRGCKRHTGILLDLSHVLARHFRERVVVWRCAIWVQTEDDSRQVRIVGRWASELVIRLPRPKRSASEVLQLTPPALIADLEIELAIWAKKDLTCVVIAAHGLAGV